MEWWELACQSHMEGCTGVISPAGFGTRVAIGPSSPAILVEQVASSCQR